MATRETAELGPAHPPKPASIAAYKELFIRHAPDPDAISQAPFLPDVLLHKFHADEKHETTYFHVLRENGLTARDLIESIKPSEDDANCPQMEEVRVARTAYGFILFAKVRIPVLPEDGPCYLHVRLFEPEPGTNKPAELHSILTDSPRDNGGSYEAIYPKDELLEWFDD